MTCVVFRSHFVCHLVKIRWLSAFDFMISPQGACNRGIENSVRFCVEPAGMKICDVSECYSEVGG